MKQTTKFMNTPRRHIQKTILLLLVLCSMGTYLLAQNKDSLLTAYQKHLYTDSVKADLAIDLGWACLPLNRDSAFFYTRQAKDIAEKAGYRHGIARAFEQFGDLYYDSGQSDSSLLFYKKSLRLYLVQKNRKRAAIILKCMGGVYYGRFEFAQALDCYKKCLRMRELLGLRTTIATDCLNIGAAYKESGQYQQAVEYYFKGLKAAEELNQEEAVAKLTCNMAIVYERIGKFKECFDYASRSLTISRKIGNPLLEINAINVLGQQLFIEKKYDQAIALYKGALQLAVSTGHDQYAISLSAHLGDIYQQIQAYPEALSYYSQTIAYAQKTGNIHYLSQAFEQTGKVYMELNDRNKGIEYLERGLAVSKQAEMPNVEIEIRHDLALAYSEKGDFKKAFSNMNRYTALKDSMYKVDEKSAIQQLHFDHELYKKRQEIVTLENEKTIQAERDKNQRILLLFLITVLCFAGIIIYFLISGSRRRKAAMTLIAAQKLEIEDQAVHLKQLNDLKTRTFSIISHDLRNPIAALSMLIELMDKKLITDGNFFEAMQGINGQLYSLNTVLENLLIWSRNQMEGRERHNPSRVDLHMLAEQSIALLRESAMQKGVTLVNDIVKHTAVLADNEHIDIVIRNLVANAVKFTKANGRVTVGSHEQGDKIVVTVRDTGIGMSRNIMEQLFSYTHTVTNYGTKGEKGTGLGLLICKEFIDKNGGTISVESEEGKGSTFYFDLQKAG